jgi:hypothetical protein
MYEIPAKIMGILDASISDRIRQSLIIGYWATDDACTPLGFELLSDLFGVDGELIPVVCELWEAYQAKFPTLQSQIAIQTIPAPKLAAFLLDERVGAILGDSLGYSMQDLEEWARRHLVTGYKTTHAPLP